MFRIDIILLVKFRIRIGLMLKVGTDSIRLTIRESHCINIWDKGDWYDLGVFMLRSEH